VGARPNRYGATAGGREGVDAPAERGPTGEAILSAQPARQAWQVDRFDGRNDLGPVRCLRDLQPRVAVDREDPLVLEEPFPVEPGVVDIETGADGYQGIGFGQHAVGGASSGGSEESQVQFARPLEQVVRADRGDEREAGVLEEAMVCVFAEDLFATPSQQEHRALRERQEILQHNQCVGRCRHSCRRSGSRRRLVCLHALDI